MANNLSERQLGLAYWYVTHKLLLRDILIVFMIIVIVFFVSLNLYLLIINLGISRNSYQQLLTSLVTTRQDFISYKQAALPKPIQINQLANYPSSKGFDIVASAVNPNKTWYATFDYQFQIGDKFSIKRSGFILPAENKYLVALAVDNGNQANQLVFSNIKWMKEINYPNIYQEKYNLEIKDATYIPPQQLGVGDKVQISRVTFTALNKSAYNYRDISFLIFVKAGDQIVGVNQITSGPIYSNQTRVLGANFFQLLPVITGVSVIPEINILNNNSFIKI
ncbi:MAG: hypothetical protein NT116_06720 [Candidatus Parcubacteria bacterium]|nr:hypothetical protein [Candidatus Parcubacteria bacterium]